MKRVMWIGLLLIYAFYSISVYENTIIIDNGHFRRGYVK